MQLIGRRQEIEAINRLLQSNEAEFLALYGRRRIGKTFLIEEHCKKQLCFHLTGLKDGLVDEQLDNFHKELNSRSRKKRDCPKTWQEAFQQLAEHLQTLRGKGKRVIFLDELPWLASRRSRFLSALDYFWNTFLSKDPRFVLVICGSAASWMITKVIDHKGGLHNRVTSRMKLEPFTLAESAKYLKAREINLTNYDQLTLAMAMGGVPHYLKQAQPGKSAAQIVDHSCFNKDGLLHGEFDRLYNSLFENADRHVDIVRELAKHPQGITRSTLTKVYRSGGRLTQTLQELEEAGFITTHSQFDRQSKDLVYRLADEYSLFFVKFIEKGRNTGAGTFMKKLNTPAWRAWSGYALESLAHKHTRQIEAALGIAQIETTNYSWVHRANKTWPNGAQVDLLIDRADKTINLVEIKFSQGPFTITKAYATELRRKVQVFRDVTGTRKNVFLTFLTSHGLTENAYSKEIVDASISTDCLFKEIL